LFHEGGRHKHRDQCHVTRAQTHEVISRDAAVRANRKAAKPSDVSSPCDSGTVNTP
jgi:hypothetical protein